MMRLEIDFEQRDTTLFATLRRDHPKNAAPLELEAHNRIWNALTKFCGTNKIALHIPAPITPLEPKPLLSAQP